jgi:DNA processing protein
MNKQIKGRDIIVYLATKYQGDWNRIYEAIKGKELVDETTVNEVISSIKSNVCAIIDDDYPEALKKSYKPPFVLFYYGDLKALSQRKNLTMLAHDQPNKKLLGQINTFAKSLSKRYGIITVLNNEANQQVMSKVDKDSLLTVIGFNGIDQMKESTKNLNVALLLSEYPGNITKSDDNLPWAVRIASSLGDKLLVSKTEGKSYLGIAIGYSLYLDKQVLALNKVKGENDENITTVDTVHDVEAVMEPHGWTQI